MRLPILDSPARTTIQKAEARALGAALRCLEAGELRAAHDLLAPLTGLDADAPDTAVRAQARLVRAGLHLMEGHAVEALALLAKLEPRPPMSGSPEAVEHDAVPVDHGFRLMLRAHALRLLGRCDEAVAAARASLVHGATSARLLALADAEKHAGALDDAIATIERLLVAEPRHAVALAQLAGYHNLRGDLTTADETFARFEACCDESADGHRGAAFFFATRGDRERTLHHLRAALVKDAAGTEAYLRDEAELRRFDPLDVDRAGGASGGR
jgi:tetratricopeptide (TPR) repeat protein